MPNRPASEPPNGDRAAESRSADVRCTHCGLIVPPGLVDAKRTEQFCCNGCRVVYETIHGCGLDRFYRLRDQAGSIDAPAHATDRRYGEFDDAVFSDLYCQSVDAAGTCGVELYLEGVHCAACVWLVEKLPSVLPGVLEARLDIRRSLVRIRWDKSAVALSRIARTLDSLGYPPHPAKDARSRRLQRQQNHRFLIRLGVAAVCAGNVMTLAFALYGGLFTGMEAQYSQLFRLTSMGFGLMSLAWPGNLFFRGAWAALRTRTAHLDLPIALALLSGGVAGTVNAIRGVGEIYFDSLTMLVFLLLLGRWIQRRQQRWSADAVELLFSLTPSVARRVEGQAIREVPIEAVGTSDVLEIRAGDSVPADGVIVDGQTNVDMSLLTGESQPVPLRENDVTHAGTLNLTGRVLIKVQSVGTETRIGKLMQLVEQCGQRHAPIVQFADRLAGWFVLVVLTLAVVTFAVWTLLDPTHAVDHAVALLIVTCPCGLGLATPLAVTVALGRAARRRILIKGGQVLEILAGTGRVILDKTGTLTAGRTTVVNWTGDTSIQPLVAALEARSAHPVAQALVSAFGAEPGSDRQSLTVSAIEQQPGAGVAGVVNGHRLIVGTRDYLESTGIILDPTLSAVHHAALERGTSPVLIALDGEAVAAAELDDPLRDDAAEAIQKLQAMGWQPEILSGDHAHVTARVAAALHLPEERAKGGATPEDKLDYIQSIERSERVIMVGDGVNDAAALSAATVGIAVHGGAEASLTAADVYLNRPGLRTIVELVDAARNTLRTIRRGLMISIVYNAVAASLAMAGWIGPLLAAVLMPISSFTVLAFAYFSRTFGDTA